MQRSVVIERGASEQEVFSTVENGEIFPAKYGRTGFRRNFFLMACGEGGIVQPNRLRRTL